MNIIKIMSKDLANKIAAGEVIENQASVVKELVENSIDANATKIEINLIDSGFQLIQIIDNGLGMSKEDLMQCVKEHATSKLLSEYDLFNIKSLGFRGEALASIVSIAKVKISTNNGIEGHNLVYQNDEIIINKGYEIKGTKISVYNLFYNVPARLKYLKSQNSELANIIDLVNKFALTYPNISFTLINNGKTLLNTNGNDNIKQVVSNVYSLDIAKNLEALVVNNDDFSIKGYISNHNVTRSNKKGINIFINKRLVYNKELIDAIIKGYAQYLMERRYPIVIFNITCDYQLIDVNVHPAKREVRISKIDTLTQLIENSIKNHFNIKKQQFVTQTKVIQPSFFKSDNIVNNNAFSKENISVNYPTSKRDVSIEINEIQSESKYNDDLRESINNEVNTNDTMKQFTDNSSEDNNYVQEYLEFSVIGQFNASYILASSKHGLHLIDQHAAMERINYEKSLLNFDNLSYQELIVPVAITLSLNEKMKLIELKRDLLELGLNFETQANNDIIFRKIPNWIEHNQAALYLEQAVSYVLGLSKQSALSLKKEQLIQAACKSSLKANQILSLLEQQTLLNELVKTNNYDHCPHGRPIIITYSLYEIEKMFKRVI